MTSQFATRLWKWVVPAGITAGLLGLWSPAGADDAKVEVKVVREGEEERKEEEQREVKRDGERKEEGREEEPRREEVRKGQGQGHNDARIDELSKIVKQLAGQVNELREEVRGLRAGGSVGVGNPEEIRKRMEEMAKKFGADHPNVAPEKMKEEMEKRMQEMAKKFAAANPNIPPEKMREEMEKRMKEMAKKFGPGGPDAVNLEKLKAEMEKRGKVETEAQIRREIERLNAELKKIRAAREGEEDDKVEKKEPKEEVKKEEGKDE